MSQETGMIADLIATFGAVFAVISLIVYILDAIGTFRYLKVRGYANAWLGFIPIVNIYATVDATYGNVDKISLYGLQLPAIIVKLYPLILGGLSAVFMNIPFIQGIAGIVIFVAQTAIMVMVLKDMMYRIGQEISTGFAILAVVITVIGAIKIISACKGLRDGEYDYTMDSGTLDSQDGSGPLSGIGKK